MYLFHVFQIIIVFDLSFQSFNDMVWTLAAWGI